jgi:hypothetical protein
VATSACTGEIGTPLPDGAIELDAEPGDALAIGAVRLRAPDVGMGVWAEVLFDDGGTATALVLTLDDGRVVYVPEAQAENAGEASAGGSPGPCADTAHVGLPWKWNTPYAWTFRAGSTPAANSKDNVEAKLKRAAANVTASRNSCNMADQVGAQHSYLGRADHGAQISAGAECGNPDGHSAVAFGDLPAGTLGTACVWFSGNEALEADVKLNKADHAWIASNSSGCSGRWSVEAVGTHEFGHVFGLGHVGEAAHGNLTMSPQINGPCQRSEATLGRGDVLGLRAKY